MLALAALATSHVFAGDLGGEEVAAPLQDKSVYSVGDKKGADVIWNFSADGSAKQLTKPMKKPKAVMCAR